MTKPPLSTFIARDTITLERDNIEHYLDSAKPGWGNFETWIAEGRRLGPDLLDWLRSMAEQRLFAYHRKGVRYAYAGRYRDVFLVVWKRSNETPQEHPANNKWPGPPSRSVVRLDRRQVDPRRADDRLPRGHIAPHPLLEQRL